MANFCTVADVEAFLQVSVPAGGLASVQAESLGDHSVTYGAEAGGESMILGASGAPILLRSEKEALARYCV